MSNIQSTTAPLTTEIVRFGDDQLATFHGFDVKAYQDGPLKRNYSEPVLKSKILLTLAPYLKVKDLFSLIASTKNWDRDLNLNTLMNQFIDLNDEKQIDNLILCLKSLSPNQKTSILRLEVAKLMGLDTWEWMNQLNINYLPYHRVSITNTEALTKLMSERYKHLIFVEELFIIPIEVSIQQLCRLIIQTPLLKKICHPSPLKMDGCIFNEMIKTLQNQRPNVDIKITQQTN